MSSFGIYQSIYLHPNGSYFAVEVHNCYSEGECISRSQKAIMSRLESLEYNLIRTRQISEYTKNYKQNGNTEFFIMNVASPLAPEPKGYEQIIKDLKGLVVVSKDDFECDSLIVKKGQKGKVIGGKIEDETLWFEIEINGQILCGKPHQWKWLDVLWNSRLEKQRNMVRGMATVNE